MGNEDLIKAIVIAGYLAGRNGEDVNPSELLNVVTEVMSHCG